MYLCNSLQAHVVAFALALSQLLQSHSHLPDEFISSESVHVTHAQPFTHTQEEEKVKRKQVSQRENFHVNRAAADSAAAAAALSSAYYREDSARYIQSASEQSISLLHLQHTTSSRRFHTSGRMNDDKSHDCRRERCFPEGFNQYPSWLLLHQALIRAGK